MPRSLRSTRQMDQQTVHAVPASVEAVSPSAEGPPAGTQRSVMKFMPGKISANKYEQRVDNCTKQQLSLLLNSADYQRFQKSKLTPQNASWKPLTAALFGLFCLIALFLAALAPQYLSALQQQVLSVSRPATLTQPDAAAQPQTAYQELIPGSIAPESLSDWGDSGITTDSWLQAQMQENAYTQHLHDSLQAMKQQEKMLYEQSLSDNDLYAAGADTEREHGPHEWVGDLELTAPTAGFGICTLVAALVSSVVWWKHRITEKCLQNHVRGLRAKLLESLHSQADAEQSLTSLKEQLASMRKVHEQLEEAVKALQGKLDLREQEMEVLNMELLAKTKLAELQREYREKMALHMPLPQGEDDISEPCASERGDLMTPPQPAPRDTPADPASDTEMSFRDLVDDSDEEERLALSKALNSGQVLVDAEDLENWAEMETEYQQLQEECQELTSVLQQRDLQLCDLDQQLRDLAVRMKGEAGSRDDTVKELRRWLDQAQGQLQNTQTALHEREEDCKTLEAAIDSLQAFKDKVTASQEAGEEQSSSLAEMQEGLKKSSVALEAAQAQVAAGQEEVQELTQRLTAAQADIASLQAQLGAAEAREAALAREQEIMQGALTGQVAGVMDMMKGLRVSLSTKLSESQAVCQALAHELAAQKAKTAAYERGAVPSKSGLSAPTASASGSGSLLAFNTPNSTLAITAASTTPGSVTGSVAGPLALTPVRRLGLPDDGLTPGASQAFTDPCSPVALTPEGSVMSASSGPLALTPSPLPARLPSQERESRSFVSERALQKSSADTATSSQGHSEGEQENIPPAGTPPSERKKLAVKRVMDACTRHGQWHLVAFLREMGIATAQDLEPVSQAQFDRVKDNGLRALHPANLQDKDEQHKAAAAEARRILQSWEFPGPKTGAKPVSPYWFARS